MCDERILHQSHVVPSEPGTELSSRSGISARTSALEFCQFAVVDVYHPIFVLAPTWKRVIFYLHGLWAKWNLVCELDSRRTYSTRWWFIVIVLLPVWSVGRRKILGTPFFYGATVGLSSQLLYRPGEFLDGEFGVCLSSNPCITSSHAFPDVWDVFSLMSGTTSIGRRGCM